MLKKLHHFLFLFFVCRRSSSWFLLIVTECNTMTSQSPLSKKDATKRKKVVSFWRVILFWLIGPIATCTICLHWNSQIPDSGRGRVLEQCAGTLDFETNLCCIHCERHGRDLLVTFWSVFNYERGVLNIGLHVELNEKYEQVSAPYFSLNKYRHPKLQPDQVQVKKALSFLKSKYWEQLRQEQRSKDAKEISFTHPHWHSDITCAVAKELDCLVTDFEQLEPWFSGLKCATEFREDTQLGVYCIQANVSKLHSRDEVLPSKKPMTLRISLWEWARFPVDGKEYRVSVGYHIEVSFGKNTTKPESSEKNTTKPESSEENKLTPTCLETLHHLYVNDLHWINNSQVPYLTETQRDSAFKVFCRHKGKPESWLSRLFPAGMTLDDRREQDKKVDLFGDYLHFRTPSCLNWTYCVLTIHILSHIVTQKRHSYLRNTLSCLPFSFSRPVSLFPESWNKLQMLLLSSLCQRTICEHASSCTDI